MHIYLYIYVPMLVCQIKHIPPSLSSLGFTQYILPSTKVPTILFDYL